MLGAVKVSLTKEYDCECEYTKIFLVFICTADCKLVCNRNTFEVMCNIGATENRSNIFECDIHSKT